MFALHLLDVGQGEAILLDFPNGSFGLVDGGPKESRETVLAQVEERISAGCRFRFLAVTHLDADHIGAVPEILRRHRPDEVLRSGIDLGLLELLCERLGQGKVSAATRSLREACRETDVFEHPLFARQEIRDLGADVRAFAVSPGRVVQHAVEDLIASHRSPTPSVERLRALHNRSSLALWIRAYGRNLLLTGEVGRDEVLEMRQHFVPHGVGGIPHDDPRASWIKLPHHGSERNACPELFQYLAAPRFVASASHGARGTHPHPEVLRLLRFGGSAERTGSAMCTRLGRACSLIQVDPHSFPADRPQAWVDGVEWPKVPNPGKSCFGTVSVRIAPDGSCEVRGSSPHEVHCPYGGPRSGSMIV